MPKITKIRKKQLRANVLEELDKLSVAKKNIKPKKKISLKKPVIKNIPKEKKLLVKKPSNFEAKKMLNQFGPNQILSIIRKFFSVKVVIGLVIIAGLLLILVIDIFGIYHRGFRGGFSWGVAKTFNLSAGRVNGQKIPLADYMTDIKTMERALTNDREGLISGGSDESSIEDRVFGRLVANILMEAKLSTYGGTVSEEDLNEYMADVIGQVGGVDNAKTTIRELYGLTLDQFKYQVVRPLLLQQALQAKIINDVDNEFNLAIKDRAEAILQEVLISEEDFGELADKYTEDALANNNKGDLGWISRGEFPPDLEDILFSLPVETVYDQLVTSESGYHIFRVGEQLIDSETGRESIRLSHILIKIDANEYVKELVAGATIERYIE